MPLKQIMLIGGTSDTAGLAEALAARGLAVLVSTATDEALDVGTHPQIRRRNGPLDVPAMVQLLRAENCVALVCAAHPYAQAVRATARSAAAAAGVPCLVYERPGLLTTPPDVAGTADTPPSPDSPLFAADHVAAADLAFAHGRRVLLTTGANNLQPYADSAKRTGGFLAARVLPRPESLAACRAAGIPDAQVIAARAPFGEAENRELIRRFAIDVLVTKDSGEAGGVTAKLNAARAENCRVIIVQRPPDNAASTPVWHDPIELVNALLTNSCVI